MLSEQPPDTAGSFVYLVYEPSGRTVAVIEDDADYAAQVAESNLRWGWTIERRSVWPSKKGPFSDA